MSSGVGEQKHALRVKRITDNALGLLVLALALVVWEVSSRLAGSVFVPPFSMVLQSFVQDWFGPQFIEHAVPSLVRMFLGYLIAAALGIVLGILIGSFKSLSETLDPFLEFFRAVPPTVIIPVGILLLGIGNKMQVLIIAFGVFWPILLNSTAGARSVSQERLDTATNFGLGRAETIRRIVFPSALPMICTGLRVALSLALIMMLVSELVASTNGIGYYILEAQRSFDIPAMFGGILLIAVLGYVLNNLFLLAEHRLLAWHYGQTARSE